MLTVAGAMLLAVLACRRSAAPAPPAEAVVLARQQEGLAALVSAPAAESLVRFDDHEVLVAVSQTLVQELLASAVPFERTVDGRYRIQITGASVRFEDGCALVRLDGRASLAGAEGQAFADVTVYGTLDVVDLDPASGLLRGRVRLLAVDARRVAVLGVSAPEQTERLVEDLGRQKLQSFEVLAAPIQIPVHFESAVRIPGLGPQGGVRIQEAEVPLRLAVTQVRAFRGKLWVSIQLATAGGASATPARPPVSPVAKGDVRGASFDELRRRLTERVARDPVVPEVLASTASDVVVGIRPALVQDLLREAASRYLDRVDLDLDVDTHVHESRTVEVDTPLGHVQAGSWTLDLDVQHVRGTLFARTPRVEPAGSNRVHVEVPVVLDHAEGSATAHFAWQAKSMARMVCRDFELTRRLEGRILGDTYPVAGDFVFSAGPTAVLARPVFPSRRFHIRVDLSGKSWRAVGDALREQDQLLRCGMALDPEAILAKLRGLLDKGFDLTLPASLFRTLELPAGLRQSVPVEDRQVDLVVSTTDLRVTPHALWYGAAIRSRVAIAASPGAPARPTP